MRWDVMLDNGMFRVKRRRRCISSIVTLPYSITPPSLRKNFTQSTSLLSLQPPLRSFSTLPSASYGQGLEEVPAKELLKRAIANNYKQGSSPSRG